MYREIETVGLDTYRKHDSIGMILTRFAKHSHIKYRLGEKY